MMSMESLFRLGSAFAKVMARKVLPRRDQLRQFVTQYQPDGIVPFTREETIAIEQSSACIACARCDHEALARDAFSALGPRGPMAFVLGVARHSGAHDSAEITHQATGELLMALEQVCPVGVPFVPLATMVARRRDAIRTARAHALPASADLPART